MDTPVSNVVGTGDIFVLFFLLVGEGPFLSHGLFDVEGTPTPLFLPLSSTAWLGCDPAPLAQGDAADDAILRAVTAQQVHWLRSGKRDSKLKQRRQQFAKVSKRVCSWEVEKEGWMGLSETLLRRESSERRGFASWEGSVLAARRLDVWPVDESADFRAV